MKQYQRVSITWAKGYHLQRKISPVPSCPVNKPGSDVKFTSVYDTGQFKEDWKPAFDPDLIGFWDAAIFATVFLEHLEMNIVVKLL